MAPQGKVFYYANERRMRRLIRVAAAHGVTVTPQHAWRLAERLYGCDCWPTGLRLNVLAGFGVQRRYAAWKHKGLQWAVVDPNATTKLRWRLRGLAYPPIP